MDVMMPEMDGFEALRELRKFSPVPVVLLTVKADERDVIHGLELGADDYIAKPFSPGCCCRASRPSCAEPRRRRRRRCRASLQVDDRLTIDFDRHEVWKDGEKVQLRPTEFRLLYHLASNPGVVMTHETLLSRVWGPEYRDASHYVRLYINYLRQKLEDDPANPRYILTERGVGYRFADRVSSCSRSTASGRRWRSLSTRSWRRLLRSYRGDAAARSDAEAASPAPCRLTYRARQCATVVWARGRYVEQVRKVERRDCVLVPAHRRSDCVVSDWQAPRCRRLLRAAAARASHTIADRRRRAAHPRFGADEPGARGLPGVRGHQRSGGARRGPPAGLPDLVVMDVMMPEMDGFEALRELRKFSPVPVVLLTVKADERDVIHGLELGADDYIAKPFSPGVLLSRIKAVLRRAEAPPQAPASRVAAGRRST